MTMCSTPSSPHRIVRVSLDEKTVVRRSPEVEHERAVAIFDLLEENLFHPLECPEGGPYHLHLRLSERRIIFDIRSADDRPLTEVSLPLTPFRNVVKDYFLVCENYFVAIKRSSPAQIETIDIGRRAIHNEGSEMLRQRLAKTIVIDHHTARRLFTLLCVLHIRV